MSEERVLQGRGDRQGRQWSCQRILPRLLLDQARLHDHLGEFFHKQGHPIGFLQQCSRVLMGSFWWSSLVMANSWCPWTSPLREMSWCVSDDDAIDDALWQDDKVDMGRWQAGHCFRTAADTEQAHEKVKEVALHLHTKLYPCSELRKLSPTQSWHTLPTILHTDVLLQF